MLSAWVVLLFVQSRRRRPTIPPKGIPTTTLPEALPPALAGALATRHIADVQIGATLLDLVARGALQLEPQGKQRGRYTLADSTKLRDAYEQELWQSLERHAKDGTLTTSQLMLARNGWKPVRQALRDALIARGWFDRDALALRPPIFVAASVGFVAAIAMFILAAAGSEPFGLAASVVLFAAAIFAYAVGATLAETTAVGEEFGTAWRSYQTGIRQSRRDPSLDLDVVMPYAVALGTASAFTGRLREAGKAGYTPIWMGSAFVGQNFYPYWAIFAASSGSVSESGSGAGAAAGGGGAGGSF